MKYDWWVVHITGHAEVQNEIWPASCSYPRSRLGRDWNMTGGLSTSLVMPRFSVKYERRAAHIAGHDCVGIETWPVSCPYHRSCPPISLISRWHMTGECHWAWLLGLFGSSLVSQLAPIDQVFPYDIFWSQSCGYPADTGRLMFMKACSPSWLGQFTQLKLSAFMSMMSRLMFWVYCTLVHEYKDSINRIDRNYLYLTSRIWVNNLSWNASYGCSASSPEIGQESWVAQVFATVSASNIGAGDHLGQWQQRKAFLQVCKRRPKSNGIRLLTRKLRREIAPHPRCCADRAGSLANTLECIFGGIAATL